MTDRSPLFVEWTVGLILKTQGESGKETYAREM